MKKILVISAYPNDETLGAGGSILKHAESGDEIHWLILTKPEESKWSKQETVIKLQEVNQVAKKYNFTSMRRLNFLPGSLKDIPRTELIDVLKGNFELIKPNIIYLPFGYSPAEDYTVAFEASIKALKSFKIKVDKILSYEIISSLDFMAESFKPNIFVDISDFLDKKLDIMNTYETQVEGYPMPGSIDSVKSLAKVRGAIIETEYAEAFMLIREIC